MRKGQVLAGIVTGVWNGQVFVDVGQAEMTFRSSGAARNFRKGDVLFCEVAGVHGSPGRIKLKEPVPGDARQGLRWQEKEKIVGWWYADGDHPSRAAVKFKKGALTEGVITAIKDGSVFVNVGAPRDGVLAQAKQVRKQGYRVGDTIGSLKVLEACPRSGKVALEMPRDPDERDVIARVERDWGKCLALYVHGSTIFSNKPPSDIDLLAVVDEPTLKEIRADTVASQFQFGRYEVTVYTRSVWLRKLTEMDLTMLTCMSLPDRFVLHELDPQLRSVHLDPAKLHETIVGYAEFTWIKAHFMLERRRDVYKASKNVYFVFRVLELGTQLLQHGRIVDFHAANPWWERVTELFGQLSVQPGDWDIIEAALASEVQGQFLRFHGALPQTLRRLLPPALRGGPAPLIAEFLCARPVVCLLAAPEAAAAACEAPRCSLCSEPLSAEKSPVVTLVRCGHRFHRSCATARLRARDPPRAGEPLRGAGCWECGRPLQLGLDEELLEARWRRTCGPNRPVLFGCYPATVLLRDETDGQLEAVAAGSASRMKELMMV